MIIQNIDKMKYSQIKERISSLRVETSRGAIDLEQLMEAASVLEKDDRKNVRTLGENTLKFIDKQKTEILRVTNMYNFDKSFGKFKLIAGVDEVGRGPLAGPIVSAAVILNQDAVNHKDIILGVNDSKKLSSKVREELACIIREKAIAYSISSLDHNSIDSNGIAWCNNEVFKMAIKGLKITPELVLSDGYPIKNFNVKNMHVIKGDAKSASIACASIIAKVYRDKLMEEYGQLYTYYNFEGNSGYGTEEHIRAIKKYGPCKIHRMSFLKNIV
jgi:ribonuclease HII